jgi:hypothetical protein
MQKLLSWLKKAAVALIDGILALDAKAKKIKWARTKAEVVGAVLLIAATAIIVNPVKHKQQPAATVKKVTVKKVVENPAPKQAKAADVAITKQTTTKVSGTVKTKPKATAKESKYTIPLSGEATTTYTDTETGTAVGTGTHPVTGQADITVQDDIVTADVTINDTNQVAMIIKRKPCKNEFGGYVGVAACSDPYVFIGGYYQRNLAVMQTKKADLALFARISVERHWGAAEDWEGRLMAGVRVEW